MKSPRNEQAVPAGLVGQADDIAPLPTFDPPDAAAESVDADADGIHARPWRLVDEETPRDGTLIQYKVAADDPDSEVGYARWRITRRRDPLHRRWERIGFWADPITSEELALAPDVWRMPEGYATPGMVI